jgi:hypothetical protein
MCYDMQVRSKNEEEENSTFRARALKFGLQVGEEMKLRCLSRRGREREVGASDGIFGNGGQIIGDEVGRGLGRFAVVEFVGAGGEGEDIVASTELGGVGFGDEVAFRCFHQFAGEYRSQSAAPAEGFLRKKFFLGQSVVDGFFMGVDFLEGLGDLFGVLGVEAFGKAFEIFQTDGLAGEAHEFPNENSTAGRFVAKADGIEVTCGGSVGLLLHFGEATFGFEGEGQALERTQGAHGIFYVIGGIIVGDAGLVGKAAASESKCRAVLVDESLEIGLTDGVTEGVGAEDIGSGAHNGVVAIGIGQGRLGSGGLDASQENDGGKQDVSEDQKGEKEFDGFLRCHVCAD